jgi:hypothetical protein
MAARRTAQLGPEGALVARAVSLTHLPAIADAHLFLREDRRH